MHQSEPITPVEERVVLLPSTAKDGQLSHSVLKEVGIGCVVCEDWVQLRRALDAGAGVVVVAEEMLGPDEASALRELVRRQPAWSDLPIVVLTHCGTDSSTARWALETLSNVTLLERPLQMATFISSMRAALRARRRQLQIRDYLIERKRAEEALRQERDFTSAVLETVGSLVVVLDREGRIVRFNHACQEVTAYRAEEVIGRSIWEVFILPEERSETQAVFQALLKGEFPNQHENYWLSKRGERRLIAWSNTAIRDEQGQVAYVIGTGTDITEKRKAEAMIRESEERFRATFEQAAVGIAHVDLDGKWLRLNRRLCDIVGYPKEELLQKTFQDITYPEDLEADLQNMRRLLAGEINSYAMEKRYIRRDGSLVWVNLTGSLVRDAAGAPRYFIAVVEDISQRKLAEEQLREAKQQAEAASRAKDQFLAALSHELRTPLTPVLATVSLLETDQRLDEDLQEDLRTVRRNIELEARLIDDLLDLTRIARGKINLRRQEADVHVLLDHARDMCCENEVLSKQIHLSTDYAATEHRVWGDPVRLTQIFWNLLHNASKFTPVGGRIELHTWNPQPGQIRIEVRDTGVGIAPQDLGRIFEPFEQAHRKTAEGFGGLGLGLAISKAFVAMHGGSIRAHSAGRGKGATFTVDLPVREAVGGAAEARKRKPAGKKAHPAARVEAGQPLRILLVEDHGDTARIMAQILEMQGHRVRTAGTVASAVAWADREDFDVVVSDLGLPDGSGLEVMRELRSRQGSIKGIALSGYGQEEDVRRSLEAGFAQHLTKPINMQAIEQAIARVIA